MTEEAIRTLAYRKWEEEGRPEGSHERHWLEAEAEYRRATVNAKSDFRGGLELVRSGAETASSSGLETKSHSLVQRYLALGGKRLAKVDDNIINVRKWDDEPAAAEEFWQNEVETLPEGDRKQVEILLPNISER